MLWQHFVGSFDKQTTNIHYFLVKKKNVAFNPKQSKILRQIDIFSVCVIMSNPNRLNIKCCIINLF